jgi:hypothetical protein
VQCVATYVLLRKFCLDDLFASCIAMSLVLCAVFFASHNGHLVCWQFSGILALWWFCMLALAVWHVGGSVDGFVVSMFF